MTRVKAIHDVKERYKFKNENRTKNISPPAGFVKGAGKRSVPNLMGEPNIDDGFDYGGRRYPPLSAIAREVMDRPPNRGPGLSRN